MMLPWQPVYETINDNVHFGDSTSDAVSNSTTETTMSTIQTVTRSNISLKESNRESDKFTEHVRHE